MRIGGDVVRSAARWCASALMLATLATPLPVRAGNIFITGHDIDGHDGQYGYDTAVLDFLRGGSCGGFAIERINYKIAVLGTNPGGDWGWSDSTTFAKPGFGPVTFYDTDDLIAGTVTWSSVLANDVLVVLSPRSTTCGLCPLWPSGLAELIAHAADIQTAFDNGMDIWANSANSVGNYYQFLPGAYSASSVYSLAQPPGFSLTAAGAALGSSVGPTQLNLPSHSRFTSWSPLLTVMETKPNGSLPGGEAVLSLAVCNPNYATEIDHLECYKVKDAGDPLQAVVTLDSAQFGLAEDCQVGKAVKFCVPVKKTVITSSLPPVPFEGQDLYDDRICYRVKCPKVDIQMNTEDQFGPRSLVKFKPSEICTPARKLPPGQLSVVKVNDINGNGVRDLNEPLVNGWVFDVTNATAAYDASIATGPTGIANFPSLVAGEYTVTEQMQPGWIATGPTTQVATILPGSSATVTFTNRVQYPSQLRIFKYDDLDGSGTHDAGEPVIGGWPMSISGPAGTQSATTNADGVVDLFPLQPGAYTITEGSQPGWTATGPTSQIRNLVMQMSSIVSFGNRCTCSGVPGSICGDGVQSACEECEDGGLVDGDGCNRCCGIEPPAECGNGVVEGGEDCDPQGSITCPLGEACLPDCSCPDHTHCEETAPTCNGECDVPGEVCTATTISVCVANQQPCVTNADCPGDVCGEVIDCHCRTCEQICIGGSNDGAACVVNANCPGGGVCGVPACCCMPSGAPSCAVNADCMGDPCVCP